MSDLGKDFYDELSEQLIDAIIDEKIKQVTKLIKRGADIHYDNDMPILYASQGSYDITKLLIDKGADVNIVDDEGNTPISSAYSFGNLNIIELLFQEGATLDSTDPHVIIHDYPVYHNIECLRLLIQHGFNFDKFKEESLRKSLEYKNKDLLEFILDNYPDTVTDTIITVDRRDIKKYRFIKMLINREIIDLPD